jgi:Icc-related predicted phosphoesterase
LSNTKLFFTTDLHGSDICYRKFLGAARFYQVDVLIVGGDITGKEIVSLIEQSDGGYAATVQGRERRVNGREEVEKLEQTIADLGSYPFRTSKSQMESLAGDKDKLNELFSQLINDRMKRWLALAEKHLKGTKIRCYVCPGNDDRFEIDPILDSSEFVVNPNDHLVELDDRHEMVSLGYSNITPWKCPRDIPEAELGKKIEALTAQVKNMPNCIFNFHCPPYDTGIDTAPHLDENLKPIFKAGEVEMIPVGSKSVRSAIEKNQPLLGLHGHIHESKGTFKIGRSICLNPGSEYSEGMLRGALVHLHDKGLKNYVLTTG